MYSAELYHLLTERKIESQTLWCLTWRYVRGVNYRHMRKRRSALASTSHVLHFFVCYTSDFTSLRMLISCQTLLHCHCRQQAAICEERLYNTPPPAACFKSTPRLHRPPAVPQTPRSSTQPRPTPLITYVVVSGCHIEAATAITTSIHLAGTTHHRAIMATTNNTESCLLAKLPRELRDIVWELTFAGETVDITKAGFRNRNSGLLAAYKQTREEAGKLYYHHTVFTVPPQATLHMFGTFLATVAPEYRLAIKSIHVQNSREASIVRTKPLYGDWRPMIRSNRRLMDARMTLLRVRFAEKVLRMDMEVLMTNCLAWNGEKNVEVWTPTPMEVELPCRGGRT